MKNKTFLSQWAGKDNPAAQGPAKQHEFSIYIPPLMETLTSIGATNIVDFQADEGVVAAAFCALSPGNHAVFVLPSKQDDPVGAFRKSAEAITQDARDRGQLTLVASASEIKTAQADAILLNNILGCQGSLKNVETIIRQAARLAKPGGHAIMTVPNPDGGNFSSYSCSDLPPEKIHGGIYNFQMKGETETFVNLYLTESGLSESFNRHGFAIESRAEIADKPNDSFKSELPAFIQYLYKKPGLAR